MTTTFDTLDEYEHRLARRSARAKLVGSALVLVLLVAIFGWRAFKLVHKLGHARPAPTAVVRVAPDGTLSVDGCSKNVSACLADARAAGSQTCEAETSSMASDAANAEANKACMASHMGLSITQSAR